MPSWEQQELKKDARLEAILALLAGASFGVAVVASLLLISG